MVNYIKESYNELKNHVTWTPWSEAQRLTVIVAAFSVVLALVVWGLILFLVALYLITLS